MTICKQYGAHDCERFPTWQAWHAAYPHPPRLVCWHQIAEPDRAWYISEGILVCYQCYKHGTDATELQPFCDACAEWQWGHRERCKHNRLNRCVDCNIENGCMT